MEPLASMLAHCRAAGWDGEDAAPIKATTIKRAEHLLAAFGQAHVCPGVSGGIGLTWRWGATELYALVYGDGRVQMYAKDGAGRSCEFVAAPNNVNR